MQLIFLRLRAALHGMDIDTDIGAQSIMGVHPRQANSYCFELIFPHYVAQFIYIAAGIGFELFPRLSNLLQLLQSIGMWPQVQGLHYIAAL